MPSQFLIRLFLAAALAICAVLLFAWRRKGGPGRTWLAAWRAMLARLSGIFRLPAGRNARGQAGKELNEGSNPLRQMGLNFIESSSERSQRTEDLEALARVSAALRKAVGLEELLDILLRETADVLKADAGAILLLEDEDLVVRTACRLPGLPGRRLEHSRDPFWRVIETGQAGYVPAGELPQGEVGKLCQSAAGGSGCVPVAPIRAGNHILGLIFLIFEQPLEKLARQPVRLLAAIAEIAGYAIQRVRLVENLEALVQSRTRDLSALYAVTAATNLALELPDLLNNVLAAIVNVLGPRAALLHLNADNYSFVKEESAASFQVRPANDLFFSRGGDGSLEQGLFLVAQAGLDSACVREAAKLTGPDTPWEKVMAQDSIVVQPQLPFSIQTGKEPLTACVGVPVRVKGQLQGVLSVLDESLEHLSAEDIALLAAIADHVGGAVERARLRWRTEQAAVIEERQRMARELHDTVTQTLYSLVLFAEAGKDALEAGNLEKTGSHLVRLRDTAQQALKEMRLLIYELRPLALQSEGLIGALKHRLETVEQRAGIETRLEVENYVPLPEKIEAGLYGIAQEALNNVLKHARATQVTVRLSTGAGWVDMEVADNGKGFASGEQTERGIGLASMRERARALGGVVTIHSEAGCGTRILVKIRQEEKI